MILSILMLLSVIPLHSSTIYADGSRKAIMIGTGDIKGYDKTTKKYDSIYFGVGNANIESHKEKPIQWRVLDTKTNTGEEEGPFLLSETLMGMKEPFEEITFNDWDKKNEWQGSKAQNWCKNFSGDAQDLDIQSLTTQESKAIIPTTKDDKEYKKELHVYPGVEQILQKDKVFFLSAEEADKIYFKEDKDRKAKYGQDEDLSGWWLRSPFDKRFTHYCGDVEPTGKVSRDTVNGKRLARPAFNLDKDKVLFTSPAKDIKKGMVAKAGELNLVKDTNTTEWKLTLIDRNRKLEVDNSGVKKQGSTLTIPYQNATTGTNEYISAVVEKNGTITHYGNVLQVSAGNESGTVTVQLPSGFKKNEDILYLINEQLNGDKKTDYSSEKVKVTIPEEQPLVFEHKTGYDIPEGKQGVTYTAATALSAKGGTKPYKFTVEPEVEGLSINRENKLVYTRPNVQEATTATIKVTDSAKPSAEETITINIGKVTAQQQTEYTVTMETDGNGTATANGKQQAKVKQGTPVWIEAKATNESEFKFKEWKVLPRKFQKILTDKGNPEILFTMPAENVTITAIFENTQQQPQPQPQEYIVTVKSNNNAMGTVSKDKVENIPAGKEISAVGNKLTINGKEVTATANPNYKFVKWEGIPDGGKVTGNITVTAIFDNPQQQPPQSSEVYDVIIKSNNTDWGNVDKSEVKSVPKNISPVENDNRLIIWNTTVTATAKKGYKFKEWGGEDSGNPNQIIYVAKFEPKEYKVQLTVDGNGTATASPSQAEQGKKVTITATPERGYKFEKWKVINGGVTLDNANSATTTFTMPDENVEIKASFTKKSSEGSSHDTEYYYISTKTDKHGTVEARSKAKEGTEVSVTVDPDKGYKLDEITVTDKRGRDIKIKETNRENRYKFTMPARDVTVEATFKQIKQEQPSKPTTPPTIPPTNNNKPIENNIIKKQQTTVFTIGSNIMTVITDGKATQTTIDAKPFLSQGRVMIPVRYAAESLGMQVEWNKQTQTVVLKDRENTVMIPIKTNKIIVGNQEYTSDVTPILKNGRTYLTISNIAKALRMRAGQDVKWDNKIKQVTIIKEVEVR